VNVVHTELVSILDNFPCHVPESIASHSHNRLTLANFVFRLVCCSSE
jgi:hypothetical protein